MTDSAGEPLAPSVLGALFQMMLGAPPTPGAGPFTHTYSPGEPSDVPIAATPGTLGLG